MEATCHRQSFHLVEYALVLERCIRTQLPIDWSGYTLDGWHGVVCTCMQWSIRTQRVLIEGSSATHFVATMASIRHATPSERSCARGVLRRDHERCDF